MLNYTTTGDVQVWAVSCNAITWSVGGGDVIHKPWWVDSGVQGLLELWPDHRNA